MEPPLNPELLNQREQLRRLFLMKRTEGEMLSQRGYILNTVYMMQSNRNFVSVDLSSLQNPFLGMSEEEETDESGFFLAMLKFRQETGLFQSRQEFSSVYYSVDGLKRILVLYLNNEPGKQVAKKNFSIVDEFIATGQFHNIILITTTGLGADTASRIRTKMIGYKVEVFLDSELAFTRIKHSFAPINIKHIPNDQVANWAQQEQLPPEKLPMILNIDPITKWYGANPFDVIQMELMGVTTPTMGYNRIVRQAPLKS